MRLTFLDDSDVTISSSTRQLIIALPVVAIINEVTRFNHNHDQCINYFIVQNLSYTNSPDSLLACSGSGWHTKLARYNMPAADFIEKVQNAKPTTVHCSNSLLSIGCTCIYLCH